jgi:hypothetical protein
MSNSPLRVLILPPGLVRPQNVTFGAFAQQAAIASEIDTDTRGAGGKAG